MILFNCTIQGLEHIKNSKECQDYSGSYIFKSKNNLKEDVQLIIVADGHGGNEYIRSRFGSQFAVESTYVKVKEFANKIYTKKILTDKSNIILQNLSKSILNEWYRRVISHFKENRIMDCEIKGMSEDLQKIYTDMNDSFDENNDKCVSELAKIYGTTLIMFANMDYCSIGMQIGDGRCIAFDKNFVSFEPMPLNEKCFFNKTTSICDSDAIDEFVYYVSEEKPIAIFIGSDGIDDSYSNIDEVKELYMSILNEFNYKDEKIIKEEIKKYMQIITEKGSGDDISIALIIDENKIKK